MERLRRFFTERPARIEKAHYRTFVTLGVGLASAIGIHLVVTSLFCLVGAWTLVAFNAVSVASYAWGILLNRRGWHTTAVAVALIELVIHQSLCVWVLGWEAGFQYYLLAITGIVFFLPEGRLPAKVAMLATAALSYMALMALHPVWTVQVEVHPVLLAVFRNVNVFTVFAFLGFYAYMYSRAASVAEARLEAERDKVEALLHSILPAPIARRLSDRREIIADAIPHASVLFADIVDFTPLSKRLGPAEIVDLLNSVFTEFDGLADRYGLEKIKTIGDCYMVASGVPEHRDDHVRAVAFFAIEMVQVIRRFRASDGTPLQVRVGIHTGPVVAGVIGARKFIYDLWGDTVNTASRMESHGVAGAIHVSDDVRQALGDSFEFEDRGFIEVKGRGRMRTWLLQGVRIEASELSGG